MTRPTLLIDIAFGSSPLSTPVWTDVSAYVLAFGYQRGRSRDLNRAETGTAYLVLNNEDNRFDPTNDASPYYGGGFLMEPSKRVRFRATWSGTTYTLFQGFIRGWSPMWDGDGAGSTVRLEINDAFFFFAQRKFTLGGLAFVQASSGSQIGAILDALGWPSVDRALDTGDTTIQAQSFADGQQNVLPVLQNIADTENGILFMDGAGKMALHRRSYRATKTTNDATFGAGSLPYRSCQLVFDDVEIRNDIRLTRVGGTQQTAFDPDSDGDHFRRDTQKSGLLHVTDAEVLAQANYLLSRYKLPAVRIAAMDTDGDADNALWPALLGLDLDSRVRVIRPRPNDTSTIVKDGFIDNLDVRVDHRSWKVRYTLAPVELSQAWVLGNATYGVLGTTTIPGY